MSSNWLVGHLAVGSLSVLTSYLSLPSLSLAPRPRDAAKAFASFKPATQLIAYWNYRKGVYWIFGKRKVAANDASPGGAGTRTDAARPLPPGQPPRRWRPGRRSG